jgi:tetratricopeptide (TPR) repeat protein
VAAATFALEAGRAGAFSEWKWIQRWMREVAVYWRPPPELIEWGCQVIRGLPPGSTAERDWHLAALSAAQRAGDHEFLIGSPYEERHNEQNEIEHLKHSIARVPKEPRFLLGQAIGIEWTTYPGRRAAPGSQNVRDAVKAFGDLARDPVVGPEARVRLGSLQVRMGRHADAVSTLTQAERDTRDPHLVYLANYLRGEAHRLAGQATEAASAYRRALATIPRAQSASLALAGVLFLNDRRAEAAELTEAAVAVPMPIDPWRIYGRADDRLWSRLITQLRGALR